MGALAEWVLSAALFFAPLETRPKFKGYEETPEAALARYRTIAEDIEAAAMEHDGNDKAEAALLLAVAIGESGLSYDVDVGPCYRKGGFRTRCDGGTSYSLWQLKSGVVDGIAYGGHEFQGTDKRRLAARAALKKLKGSFGMCKDLPEQDRLSAYGAGRCLEGNKSVRSRWALFQKVRSFTPTKQTSKKEGA